MKVYFDRFLHRTSTICFISGRGNGLYDAKYDHAPKDISESDQEHIV